MFQRNWKRTGRFLGLNSLGMFLFSFSLPCRAQVLKLIISASAQQSLRFTESEHGEIGLRLNKSGCRLSPFCVCAFSVKCLSLINISWPHSLHALNENQGRANSEPPKGLSSLVPGSGPCIESCRKSSICQ